MCVRRDLSLGGTDKAVDIWMAWFINLSALVGKVSIVRLCPRSAGSVERMIGMKDIMRS